MEKKCQKCNEVTEHIVVEEKLKQTSKRLMTYQILECTECGRRRALIIK